MAQSTLERLFDKKSVYMDEYWHSEQGRAVREVVFGFNDGLVTTVGFFSFVAVTFEGTRLLVLAAVAEMLAGSISMFFGGYLSTKAQREFYESEIAREEQEILLLPDKEREEVERVYRAKGFEGAELDMVVDRITSDKDTWLKCMMEEELGLIVDSRDNPLRVGLVIGAAFIVGAVLPLIPLVGVLPKWYSVETGLFGAIAFAAVGLFGIGSAKTKLTRKNWFKSGMENLIIGAIAAGAGVGFGKLVDLI